MPENENKMNESNILVADTLDDDKNTKSDANDNNIGCIGGIRNGLKRILVKWFGQTRAAIIGPTGEAPKDMFVICSKCVDTERARELKVFLKSESNESSTGRMNGGTQFSQERIRQLKKELKIERDSSSEEEEI